MATSWACMSDLAAPAVCGIFELRWKAGAMPQREPNLLLPPRTAWGDQPNSRCTASKLVIVEVVWHLHLAEVHLRLACKCLVLTRAWVTFADFC
jgi:hypothetical protein